MTTFAVPREYVWRRVHSLMGLWIVLFLLEHLLTNSQAALLLGDNGRGFVEMVNFLHNLPYLQAVEVVLIGVPLLIHAVWGIKYALSAKANSFSSDGSKPSLKYKRNKAYTWQRITSWILLIGIIAHVAKFRFLEYPMQVKQGTQSDYFVRLNMDNGLYTVAARLNVELYDTETIEKERQVFAQRKDEESLVELSKDMRMESFDLEQGVRASEYDVQKEVLLTSAQKYEEKKRWLDAFEQFPLESGQVVAVTENFGTATLLTVRDTFKSPVYVGLYTIFVLAACFHAFNGLWTFLLTWGLILKRSAQKSMVSFCVALMVIVALLGLAAIWGTYWLNLKY